MDKKVIWVVSCLILALALPSAAQEAKESKAAGWSDDDPPVWTSWSEQPPLQFQNESSEQRMARSGTAEDPGTDPDTARIWTRNGEPHMLARFPRERAIYARQKAGWVRLAGVSSPAEIYHENDEWVWIWVEIPDEDLAKVLSSNVRKELRFPEEDVAEAAEAAEPAETNLMPDASARGVSPVQLSAEARAYLSELKKEFAITTPALSAITLRFEESSKGLPTSGSWRNGLDVADINGDGILDIIAPPQRGGRNFPTIFLGTPEGVWQPWEDARWPAGYNYGTVVAGDIDGDGHMDLAIASHLVGPSVLLGDGKGGFRDASEGLPEKFPTRRVVLADVDGDGDLDLFALHEGATVGSPIERGSRLRLYINEGGAARWREVLVAEPGRQVAGDWMTAADFNGDGRVDVAGASVFFGGPDIVYLQKSGGKWEAWGRGSLPFRSYYSAMASGKISRAKGSDLILSFRRAWPNNVRNEDFARPEALSVVGLERVSWDRRGRPLRTPIVTWDGTKPVWGVATGDFDGDGNLDLVYVAMPPRRLEFLLGDGKGGFRSARAEGIDLPDLTSYDVKVADVNGDGRDDIVMMFEKSDRASDGSVRVWLGRGGEAPGEKK